MEGLGVGVELVESVCKTSLITSKLVRLGVAEFSPWK